MFALLLTALISFNVEAKLFRSAYVSFELPQNWNCKLEGTDWICTSKFSKETKEATIILTAKEVGPQDSLRAYESELKTPRPLNGVTGAPPSKVVQQPRRRNINGRLWIDALHLNSEVPGYYTRYLATIKDRLAIAVTFSAYKLHYTKYSADFVKAVESLQAIASKNILGSKPKLVNPGVGENLGTNVPGPVFNSPNNLPSEPKSKDNTTTYIAIALILLSVGVLLWRRM